MKWITISISLACATVAKAEIIASCSNSSGYSYYVAGGLVPESDAGFTTDQISDGVLQLIELSNGVDIVQLDSTGTRRSATDEGGKVVASANGTNISVIVLYEGVVENYVFRIASSEVTWSKSSFGYSIDKHAVYRAKCLFE